LNVGTSAVWQNLIFVALKLRLKLSPISAIFDPIHW
jgi:hypothetical protein